MLLPCQALSQHGCSSQPVIMRLLWISLVACFPGLSLTCGWGPCLCVVTITSLGLPRGLGTSVHPANPCPMGADPVGTTALPTSPPQLPRPLPFPTLLPCPPQSPAFLAVLTSHWSSKPQRFQLSTGPTSFSELFQAGEKTCNWTSRSGSNACWSCDFASQTLPLSVL